MASKNGSLPGVQFPKVSIDGPIVDPGGGMGAGAKIGMATGGIVLCESNVVCSSSIITTTDQTKTRENSTEFHQKNHKITNNNTIIQTTSIITTNTVVYTLRMTTVEYESLSNNVLTKNQPRGGNLSEIENDLKSTSDRITWFIWDNTIYVYLPYIIQAHILFDVKLTIDCKSK